MVYKEEFMKNILWGLKLRKYKKRAIESEHRADFYGCKRDRVKACSQNKYKGSER